MGSRKARNIASYSNHVVASTLMHALTNKHETETRLSMMSARKQERYPESAGGTGGDWINAQRDGNKQIDYSHNVVVGSGVKRTTVHKAKCATHPTSPADTPRSQASTCASAAQLVSRKLPARMTAIEPSLGTVATLPLQ